MKIWGNILYNYKCREVFRKAVIDVRKLHQRTKVGDLRYIRDSILSKIISSYESEKIRFDGSFHVLKRILMKNADKLLHFAFLLTTVVKNKNDTILKTISITIPLLIWILPDYNFNLLSIIYIALTLLFWYFIISCLSWLPTDKINLDVGGKTIKNVYVVEDSPDGWMIVLDKNNNILKLNKSHITRIETVNLQRKMG